MGVQLKQVLSLKGKIIKERVKKKASKTLRSEYFSLIKPWIAQNSKSFNYSKDCKHCMELIERSQDISGLGHLKALQNK